MRLIKEPQGFSVKYERTLQILKKAQELSIRHFDELPYLAFSGGKDSQAIYHCAEIAGVQFTAHHTLTTIEPPELIYFIRKHYPEVITHRPKYNFWQLCLKKKALPTPFARFCCAETKERDGRGTVVLTGIRAAESARRAKRSIAEITSEKKKYRGVIDLFEPEKDTEVTTTCTISGEKIVINPILQWTDADVWYFLNEVAHAPHCCLYDNDYARIGCILCPLANEKQINKDAARYPKYKEKLFKTIEQLRQQGWMKKYPDLTTEEIYQWWKSKMGIKSFIANTKLQTQIDFTK